MKGCRYDISAGIKKNKVKLETIKPNIKVKLSNKTIFFW